MALRADTRSDWLQALREGADASVPEAERARRRAETRRLLDARDQLARIAPDTTAEYVRQVRAEADAPR